MALTRGTTANWGAEARVGRVLTNLGDVRRRRCGRAGLQEYRYLSEHIFLLRPVPKSGRLWQNMSPSTQQGLGSPPDHQVAIKDRPDTREEDSERVR